jgi:hypothetical protein
MISTVLIAAVLIGRPVFRRHLKRLESAVSVSVAGCRGWQVRRTFGASFCFSSN